jgi:NodT family efflux transporter outer membrane factor (OMF) lipoprotein
MPRNAISTSAAVGRKWAVHALMVASLGACASYSDIQPQAKALDAAALGLASGTANSSTAVPAIDAQWWLALGDAQLNALVEKAVASSPNLRSAQARLARAQAGSDAVRGMDLPQVTASTDLTRQLFTANSIYPPPLGGAIVNTGDLRASASWELDFFGKNRAALEASLGQVRAAQADVQAARMLLASSVARSYIALQRIEAQLAVAQRTLAQRSQTKALVQDRVKAGLDTQLELQQSDGALPEARLQIETLNEQRSLALNALAALTAQPLAELSLALPERIASSPAAVAQSIPMDLLGRRADIAAARWRVEAALHDVDTAKAMFYPDINLVAFAGFSSIGFDKLTESGSQQWGVGPAIRLPLFDGGRLRANLRGKTADLDAAVESYNALVIDAVRDVADQLTSAKAIARQQNEQTAAQASAEAAYAIATQRYQAGLGNFLNVLSAETSVLTQRRLAVDLAARALDTHIQLIRALGGGYQANVDSTARAALSSQISQAKP